MYRPPSEKKGFRAQEVGDKPYLIVEVEADATQLSDEELRKLWDDQNRWMGDIEAAVKKTLTQYHVQIDTNVVLIDHNARLGKMRKRR